MERTKEMLWKALAAMPVGLVLISCSANLALDLVIGLLLVLAVWFLEKRNLMLLVAAVFLTLALGEAMLRVLSKTSTIVGVYRLDEKYFDQYRYVPNVRDAMDMPFGDIAALDVLAPRSIREPRHQEFRTDDMGWRNDSPYAGQPAVLVGDSFVAGSGTDQADLLSAVLNRDYGLSVYNAAFPGNPDDYMAFAARFLKEKGDNVRFVLFIFEGNDFSCGTRQRKQFGPADLTTYSQMKMRWAKTLEPYAHLPRAAVNMTLQVIARYMGNDYDFSETYRIGPRDVAFYGPYIDAATFSHCSFKFKDPDPAVVSHIAMAFFIPDKYRVYYDAIAGEDKPPLPRPASGLEDMRSYLAQWGIPVYDLTPAMTEAAHRLLPEGRYLFWRDDTHWGPEGIIAAAGEVAPRLREAGLADKEPAVR